MPTSPDYFEIEMLSRLLAIVILAHSSLRDSTTGCAQMAMKCFIVQPPSAFVTINFQAKAAL